MSRRVFVVCLSISLACCVCNSGSFLFFFVVGVYVLFVVCCGDVCCFIGVPCVYVLVLLFFYGVNVSPVRDCILYVPYWRCSSLFVSCCLFVYVFMVWLVVVVCLSKSLVCFVCAVLLCSCLVCLWCV